MLQQSAPTSINQQLAYVAAEARQLFQRRKVAYAVLAAVIAGITIFVAGANQVNFQQATPATNAANDEITTEKGEPMSDTTQAGNTQQSTSISVETQHSNTNSAVSRSESQVIVNGQQITVPDNGTTHTTVSGDNGSASVNVTHQSSSDGSSNSSHSSLHVDVNAGG